MLLVVGLLTVVGIVYLCRVRNVSAVKEEAGAPAASASGALTRSSVGCCGAHEVCEAETLLALSDKVIYYDDEELDRYRGREEEQYTELEAEEFRTVLLELQPHEVAGWLRSLQLRGVELPDGVRDEALMLVSDFRASRLPKP